MSSPSCGSLSGLPYGRIIDFELAELRKPPFQDNHYLWVRGLLPTAGFEAKLAPRVYHGRPDYWSIEVAVVAVPATAGADVEGGSVAFERSIPLLGITGNRGIKVIGATRIKQIEIAGES